MNPLTLTGFFDEMQKLAETLGEQAYAARTREARTQSQAQIEAQDHKARTHEARTHEARTHEARKAQEVERQREESGAERARHYQRLAQREGNPWWSSRSPYDAPPKASRSQQQTQPAPSAPAAAAPAPTVTATPPTQAVQPSSRRIRSGFESVGDVLQRGPNLVGRQIARAEEIGRTAALGGRAAVAPAALSPEQMGTNFTTLGRVVQNIGDVARAGRSSASGGGGKSLTVTWGMKPKDMIAGLQRIGGKGDTLKELKKSLGIKGNIMAGKTYSMGESNKIQQAWDPEARKAARAGYAGHMQKQEKRQAALAAPAPAAPAPAAPVQAASIQAAPQRNPRMQAAARSAGAYNTLNPTEKANFARQVGGGQIQAPWTQNAGSGFQNLTNQIAAARQPASQPVARVAPAPVAPAPAPVPRREAASLVTQAARRPLPTVLSPTGMGAPTPRPAPVAPAPAGGQREMSTKWSRGQRVAPPPAAASSLQTPAPVAPPTPTPPRRG